MPDRDKGLINAKRHQKESKVPFKIPIDGSYGFHQIHIVHIRGCQFIHFFPNSKIFFQVITAK